ncbi:hypothetical protein [Sphingobium ummariense]
MDKASIIRYAAGLLFAVATIACGPAPSKKSLTVDQVVAQINNLNGKTVSVSGYLSRCEADDCLLYRNKAESDDVDRSMSTMRKAIDAGASDVSGFKFPNHPALGIGVGSPFSFFDLRASLFENSYVVITGKVSNACRLKGAICFDRSSELEPSSIGAAALPG